MTGKENAREIYGDIIDIPHWEPLKHERMSLFERAAQFSPFAALTGYDEMIDEEAREVDAQEELSDEDMKILNQQINRMAEMLENGETPEIIITYFVPDERKSGGKYVTSKETVRRIDTVDRCIEFCRKVGVSGRYMRVGLDEVSEILM